MPGISYSLGLDPSGGIAGIKSFQGALGGLGHMAGMLAPIAGIAGGLGAVGLAAAGFKKSIDEAAKMEGFQTGFKVLLGSMDAAKERMKQLADFADNTPFELPQVAEASRVLQVFTKGVLATGKGLSLVGDVASGTGREFGEVAPLIGQLYQELNSKSGGEGRAAMELERMGALSAEAKEKIEALMKVGVHGTSLWQIASADLARYTGMMTEQSHTWNGLMSTFHDKINAVFRELGSPVLTQIKPILSEAITYVDGLKVKAHQWGVEVAWGIGLMRNLFKAGELSSFAGLELKVGFADAVTFLTEKMQAVFSEFNGANMFSGLGLVFDGLASEVSAAITIGITKALSTVSILGHPLMAAGVADLQIGGAEGTAKAGQNEVSVGIEQLQKMGGAAGKVGDFLKGLGTETEAARKQLKELQAKYGPDFDKLMNNISSAPDTKPPAPAAAAPLPLIVKDEKIKPLTDRMAQIGLFLGGNNGAADIANPEKAHRNEIAAGTQALQGMTGVIGTVRNSIGTLGDAAALASRELGRIKAPASGMDLVKMPDIQARPPVATPETADRPREEIKPLGDISAKLAGLGEAAAGATRRMGDISAMLASLGEAAAGARSRLAGIIAPAPGAAGAETADRPREEIKPLGDISAKLAGLGEAAAGATRRMGDISAMLASLGEAAAGAGSRLAGIIAPTPGAAGASVSIRPISAQLARAGSFIGGNGGVVGAQRAAESTARNTGALVQLTNKLIEKMGPHRTAATF